MLPLFWYIFCKYFFNQFFGSCEERKILSNFVSSEIRHLQQQKLQVLNDNAYKFK